MATKPTREQERACDNLAAALGLITEAVRLDGRSRFDGADLKEVAARLAKASSAFGLEVIVARALERRSRGLGLRSGSSELLLLEEKVSPLDSLLLPDDEFKELVARLEEELGGL